MAVIRDRPYGGSNFLVDIGGDDRRSAAAGFSAVVFPSFVLEKADEPSQPDGRPRLVLTRGVTGSLALYHWWDETRRERRPRPRTVMVELLADDHETVVLTWRFHGAYPVSLAYSPLQAIDGGIVMETVELAYDRVEMA